MSDDYTDNLNVFRETLIMLRNECLDVKNPDWDGAVILSHAIRWLSFKIEGKPYEAATD